MLEQHHAIIRGLAANGIDATLEYPGCVVIELGPETTVWTGLESWTYGTIHRLQGGTMHDTDEPAEPSGIRENTVDTEAIVAAWTQWVRAYKAQSSGQQP
jgi:hypothetical protein